MGGAVPFLCAGPERSITACRRYGGRGVSRGNVFLT